MQNSKRPSRKNRSSKSTISPAELHKQQVDKFEDTSNEYLNTLLKKIKNINKKLRQCDKIQTKIDEKIEVQKEELEIVNKKEKMIYNIQEYENLLFRLKEIALEDKKQKKIDEEENERHDEKAQKDYAARAEKLEREVANRAEYEHKEKIEQLKAEWIEKTKYAQEITKQNTIKFILELYFSARFIESVTKQKNPLFLRGVNEVLQTIKAKQGNTLDSPIDEKDFTFFRSFLLMVFPKAEHISTIASAKDEVANALKLVNSLMYQSDDPVDGKSPIFTFRRMAEISQSVANSAIFYNRNQQNASASSANLETNLNQNYPAQLFYGQNTSDQELKNGNQKISAETRNIPSEKKSPKKSAEEESSKAEKEFAKIRKKENSETSPGFDIPEKVPTSTEKIPPPKKGDGKDEERAVGRGRGRRGGRRRAGRVRSRRGARDTSRFQRNDAYKGEGRDSKEIDAAAGKDEKEEGPAQRGRGRARGRDRWRTRGIRGRRRGEGERRRRGVIRRARTISGRARMAVVTGENKAQDKKPQEPAANEPKKMADASK